MTNTPSLRAITFVAFASLIGASTVRAQPGSQSSDEPVGEGATTAPNAPEQARSEDLVDATWAARREYHRQLRSVDLSAIGTATSSVSLGVYAVTRDAPFTRGLGGATLAFGGVQLISSLVFTLRSQRGMSPERAPDTFREGDPYTRELEGAEHHADQFVAYLTTDTSVITAGLATALVGVARNKEVVQGVGIGIASQGVVTLLLDLLHQDQGRRYLRTLRGLDPRLSVVAIPGGGSTWALSVAWTR